MDGVPSVIFVRQPGALYGTATTTNAPTSALSPRNSALSASAHPRPVPRAGGNDDVEPRHPRAEHGAGAGDGAAGGAGDSGRAGGLRRGGGRAVRSAALCAAADSGAAAR